MKPKIAITHPSQDHADAFLVGDDGKVVVVQAKNFRDPNSRRIYTIREGHVVPGWFMVPHHRLGDYARPPKAAERLLEFIPLQFRDHLAGDLEEMYQRDLFEKGLEEARRRYWKQVRLSFVPIVWSIIKEVAGLAVLLKWIR